MENETSVNMENVAETPIETEVAEVIENVSTESVIDEVATHQDTVQSDEDNAKYAEVRRKAEEKARQKAKQEVDSKFADLFGEEYGIKSADDYLNAIKEQRERDEQQKKQEERQKEIDALVNQKNYSEDDAKKILEAEKTLQEKAEAERKSAEVNEFQSEYPNVKIGEIPKEVFELTAKGMTLTDAYSRYEVKALKAQLEQIKRQAENSEASPGTIGATDTDTTTLTEESIANMSPKELMKRWPEVKKIMKMK